MVKHQTSLLRPVYRMLRSQVYQGCPQVLRHVPPLFLEQVVAEKMGNVSTIIRGVRQSNLFVKTSASRMHERECDHQ